MTEIKTNKIEMGVSSASVGISLRDYFAAKAMQGLIADIGGFDKRVSYVAYQYADAMLAERKK